MQSFRAIESLRAYMAWWVVVGHAINLASRPPWLDNALGKVLISGDAAVNVFIIVSGFVICHLLLAKREPYPEYIRRRFFRIVPVYLVCLLLGVVTLGCYKIAYIDLPFAINNDMRLARATAVENDFGTHLAAHLTLLHGAIPDSVLKFSSSTLLGPAWSVSLEWQFYLLAPLLIAPMTRSWRALVAGFAALMVVGLVSRYLFGAHYKYPSMLLLSLPYFALGIASRLALRYLSRVPLRPEVLLGLLLVPALAMRSLELCVWALFFVFVLIEHQLIREPLPAFGALMRGLALGRVSTYMGRISYSSYLVHVPVFTLVVAACHLAFGITTPQAMGTAVLLGMALTVPVSMLLHHFIEMPFIAVGRRRRVTQAVPG